VAEHGHAPRHGDDRDIFERLYAVRLDRLRGFRKRANCWRSRSDGLLDGNGPAAVAPQNWAIRRCSRNWASPGAPDDISQLRHVASRAEKRAAEEIANREKCEDFETFKPQIERVQADLAKGARQTKASIKQRSLWPRFSRAISSSWRADGTDRQHVR
jgi:hypothetical protein